MTQQDAVNEILERFATAWAVTNFQVIYPDVALTPLQVALIDGKDESILEPWARITIRTASRSQGAFGSGGDARRWDEVGVLLVEIYTPTGSGFQQARTLGKIVQDAFEGVSTPNGVWFSEGSFSPNGSEGVWSRITYSVKWEFHEYR